MSGLGEESPKVRTPMGTGSGSIPYRQVPGNAATPAGGSAPEAMCRILDFVKEKRLIDFHAYRPGTIERMLALRVAKTGAGDFDDYYETLRASSTEVDELIQALTVKVSSFFRNPYAFEALGETVLPELSERLPDEMLRVWCAGCARGEEPYSVAILLRELISRDGRRAQPFILGTDIDIQALNAARRAEYPEAALLDVKKRYLDSYFHVDGGTYTLAGEIRSLVAFAAHDITTLLAPRGGVFRDYHLILCRNVLIYLDRAVGERAVAFLASSLASGGFLMLGEAEMIPETLAPAFSEILPDLKIYRKHARKEAP